MNLEWRVRKRRRTERAINPPPDSDPFSYAEFGKNLQALQAETENFKAVIARARSTARQARVLPQSESLHWRNLALGYELAGFLFSDHGSSEIRDFRVEF